jgi:hypothetical protein
MQVEVIFTGLCSLLNVRDNHGDEMVEPSVILVRTDVPTDPGTPGPDYEDPGPGDHTHIAFLAFSPKELTVDTPGDFKPVPEGPPFLYVPLHGVVIAIKGVQDGPPTVLASYDTIAKKDDYWPDAKNQWNRGYVPRKRGMPSKDCVDAFFRFGKGYVGGGRLCPFEWRFKDPKDRYYTNQFAEEAIYTFDRADGEIVVRLADLADRNTFREYRFFPVLDGNGKPPNFHTFFLGNNMKEDMGKAVLRKGADKMVDGDHFRFLNNVAASVGGPFPSKGPRITKPTSPSGGGGGTSGACGPHSGNG